MAPKARTADRRAAEVQVVEGADDPAEQKDDRRKQDRSGGGRDPQQSHSREQEGDDHGRKHFKKSFHPQVDHPPAPVFGDGQVRMLTPHQRGDVK